MRFEYFKLALESILIRPLRTFLTLLGIVIGVGAVVSLVSLGNGLQDAVSSEFESLGTDKVLVSPQGSFFGGGGSNEQVLSIDDVDFIRERQGVLKAGYLVNRFARVSWGEESGIYSITGTGLDDSYDLVKDIVPIDLVEGRNLRQGDTSNIIAGYDYRFFEGFEDKVKLRGNIDISGSSFRVVGINSRVGNSNDDRSIIIGIDGFKEIFDVGDSIDQIIIQVEDGVSPDEFAVFIEEELRDFRGVDEGDEDFSVETFENLLASFLGIFSVITFVIVGISAISLVVGALGIMNTMFTSVLERTQEIGVLKAIGARPNDIRKIFIYEAGILGLAGGILGIIFGYALAFAVEYYVVQILDQNLLSITLSSGLIIGAIIFSLVIGVISGALPAYRASKLNPVDALRSE